MSSPGRQGQGGYLAGLSLVDEDSQISFHLGTRSDSERLKIKEFRSPLQTTIISHSHIISFPLIYPIMRIPSIFFSLLLLYPTDVHAGSCRDVGKRDCTQKCNNGHSCIVPDNETPKCGSGQYLDTPIKEYCVPLSLSCNSPDPFKWICSYKYYCVCLLSCSMFTMMETDNF